MNKRTVFLLTIDKLILQDLEKICFLLTKMTVTDQLKIIGKKIKANQAQYDLYRLAGKIFAYYSGDLGKYEYLAGEDLDTN